MNEFSFAPANESTDDFTYNLWGNFNKDDMNTLLAKLYTTDDIKHSYPYSVGNILAYNGDIEMSQMVSLCFSEFLLNDQSPSDLNQYFEQFLNGYMHTPNGLYASTFKFLSILCDNSNQYITDDFGDTINYVGKFTSGLVTYYIHHSYKHIFIDNNGIFSIVDACPKLPHNLNKLVNSAIRELGL